MGASRVPDELDDLIRQQEGDEASPHVRVPRGRSVRTVNYDRPLDTLPRSYSRRELVRAGDEQLRPDGHDWIFLAGVNAWSMIDHARAAIGIDPCPVCGGHPRRLAYCLGCDRCGMDRAVGNRWPGKPISDAGRDDSTAKKYRIQPKYRPTMKGGKG
jgi:hypothetical protein